MKQSFTLPLLFLSIFSFGQWQPGATTGNIYYDGGNVGIGSDTPSKKSEITGKLKMTGHTSPGWGNSLGATFLNQVIFMAYQCDEGNQLYAGSWQCGFGFEFKGRGRESLKK